MGLRVSLDIIIMPIGIFYKCYCHLRVSFAGLVMTCLGLRVIKAK